jgi:peptide/nickel transport system permease protein
MVKFIRKRILYGLLVILGVVIVVFFLFNVLPGDPARMMLGQRADVASIEAINKELGRDQPLSIQFMVYLNDLSPVSILNKQNIESPFYLDDAKYGEIYRIVPTGNETGLYLKPPYLRRSYQTGRHVTDILADAMPGTAVLALAALIIAALIGIPMGAVAAVYKNKFTDYIILISSIMGMAIPSFFAGIIIAWLFGFVLSPYTGLDMTGSLYDIDPFEGEVLTLKNLILPAITLGVRPLSIIVQLTRSSMLDVLSQDYIRTARAKGLSKWVIIRKHALRNALNPVLTAISGWFGSLMAGAVFVEYIFGWKGLGKTMVDALEKYDFPVVMGTVLLIAFIFVIINIVVDLLYGVLDPRVRVS